MCGIAGFIGFNNLQELAINANKVQRHRGPDSQDFWCDEYISLAHQRLSIIDLNERANQPLHKGEYVIIYNGELYNYKILKQYLTNTYNSKFSTESDTEVVLDYFINEKEKCLDKFEGMFSFAIYNKATKESFIARDHFGIKPLFYTLINENICFSSELKTLTKVEGFSKTINKRVLISALNYLWVPGNESIFKGTYKLPPAHYMTISSDKKVKINKYWELSGEVNNTITEKEAAVKLENVLEKSVQRHMISDVPVSSFLSGGVDSSLISVIASKHINKLSTYTITTSSKDKKVEQMPDDQKYARILAQQYKFDYDEIELSPDIVKILPEIVKTLDEPIGDPAAINTYLICKRARDKGVKVLLSGMGADEIFFGYQRHRALMYARKYGKLPGPLKYLTKKIINILPVKIGGKGIIITRWAKRFLNFASLPVDEAYMRSYSYYNKNSLKNLLKDVDKSDIDFIFKYHEKKFNEKFKGDIINQVCNTDIQMFMNGLNLTYTDRASMAASVEVRVPFIDKKVIEFAMSIPGKFKFKNNQTKYVLKKSAEKFLNKDIIYRKKASFGAPIRSWISNELKPMVDDLLSKERIDNRAIFNYDFVSNLIERDRLGKEDNAYQIYQLLTIELWMQAYID
ncbi:asparagine synthase (glutamine-hydrolyzing) [uncultured Winogradskyella sp.]|uniref:asparagine synthase (glutamine-hydrolyzing) n=1 Tax=uncultured Winogradskyella sp. TaxID=395353 RepID=UPI002610A9F3|nr:asparagine synthase (glutamine-hydrolyzing) [uncultured Winogradskyella sp.]